MTLRSASLKSNNIGLASHASPGVQFYYVAVGDSMIWSNLLPIERAASPQPCEFERPGYILVHEPGDITYCVAAANDERPCAVGWVAGRLRVHTHDGQCVEHEWRESLESLTVLCRERDGRKAHAGELFEHGYFVAARIQVTLVRNQ